MGHHDTIYLNSSKTGFARINKSTEQDYPKETDLERNGDELNIAGGFDTNFRSVEFELYGLIVD